MTEEQLIEIEKIGKKSEAVATMLSEWKFFSESPLVESYTSVRLLLEEWIQQINDGRKKIDIFSEKDDKSFDRAKDLAKSGINDILISLDSIRSKMSPEQQKDIQKEKKLKKNEGVAI